jgi:NAD(P)-dependent dehydrogenase (short-subunit alcohol dehydrogenase family)
MTQHNLDRPGWRESIVRHVPIGRLMYGADVANMVLFLASDGANRMEGQDFVVDAGWLASEL